MPTIETQFLFTNEPPKVLYAKIESAELCMDWTVTEGSYEVIHGVHRAIELIPERLQLSHDMSKNENNDCTFLIDCLIRLFKTYKAKSSQTNTRFTNFIATEYTFTFPTDLLEVYTPNMALKERSLSLTGSIEAILKALNEIKDSIIEKEHHLFSDQFKTLMQMLNIQKTFSMLYETFAHDLIIQSRLKKEFQLELTDTKHKQIRRKLKSLHDHFFQDVYTRLGTNLHYENNILLSGSQ